MYAYNCFVSVFSCSSCFHAKQVPSKSFERANVKWLGDIYNRQVLTFSRIYSMPIAKGRPRDVASAFNQAKVENGQ